MPNVTVSGGLIGYELVGRGTACLVVPGWPGVDHSYLRPGLDVLAHRVRLAYYDHRVDFTMEQAAADAAAVAADLGPPVVVLGHHHGAAVAQELALRHPELLAGLVLVNGSPGELGAGESLADAFDAPPTPPEVEVLQRVPPGSDEEWASTMNALAKFFFHRLGRPEADTLFADAAVSSTVAVQAMMALGWWSSVDRLGGLGVPTLLVAGRHDVFAGAFQSERITRAAPAARLVVLEESGHLPWLEEPDAFVAAVSGWLDEVAPVEPPT